MSTQGLIILGAMIVSAVIPMLLLRRGVGWRLAMLVPPAGMLLMLGMVFWHVDHMASWLRITIVLAGTISSYLGMLSVWWIVGPQLKDQGWRW